MVATSRISSALPAKWYEISPRLMPALEAMRSIEARGYPASAMVSMAAATIWVRRASSMNDRPFWPSGSFFGCMAKI